MTRSDAAKTIALAALGAGSLDFLYATANAVMKGRSAIKLWQFVASGFFGQSAYAMGLAGAAWGVFFHYLIMTIFSVAVFFLCRQFSPIAKHRVVSGLLFGLLMWVVMNLVVVPLSKADAGPIKIQIATIANLGFVMHLILGMVLIWITTQRRDGQRGFKNVPVYPR
jgi:hypothetical protein